MRRSRHRAQRLPAATGLDDHRSGSILARQQDDKFAPNGEPRLAERLLEPAPGASDIGCLPALLLLLYPAVEGRLSPCRRIGGENTAPGIQDAQQFGTRCRQALQVRAGQVARCRIGRLDR